MKPGCEKFQNFMVEAFGGEIDPPSFSELEAHLAACADCSSDWRELNAVRQGMEVLGKFEGPSELTEARILKAADRKISTKRKPVASTGWRWILSPPALAAAMLALIIGVGIFSHQWVQRHPEVKPSMEPILAPPHPPAAGGLPATAPGALTVEKKAVPANGKPKAEERPHPVEPAKQLMAPHVLGEGEMAPAGALKDKEQYKEEDTGLKRKQVTPAESEKAISLPATGSFKEALPQAAQPEGVLKQEKLDAQAISPEKSLIAAGRAKIKIKDYQGALADFLQAQKIQDSEELRKLIALCKNELEPL